jgi:aspartate-semialdehyde dehydrogenase
VVSMKQAIEMRPDIALFSAGGSVSLEFAPQFAAVGTTVIDNSSAFRMDGDKKLIVPEINATSLTKEDNIIANPNCSTIQLVATLAPLHKKYGIKRIVVSTYQSITGTGVKAVEQLENEYEGKKGVMAYPYQIHRNAIPHCDVFEENGYTKEEMKLVRETQKILDDKTIAVTATAVRIPVVGGHSESVNVEFNNDFTESDVRRLLSETQGITVQDNTDVNNYPMPLMAHGKDDVFVGRIRRDHSRENSLNMWIVADNLRKGAATNAVQIAEYLIENNLV